MTKLTFVVYSPSREFDAVPESANQIDILAHVEKLEDLVESVGRERPDALLVALGENSPATFAMLEKLPAPMPLLFCYGPDDSQLILQAMRAGACEYISPGVDEKTQLLAAVERIARATAGSREVREAPLIAVTGAKGGVGSSFIACQLSASLAQLGGRTALVDGHLHLGDVALYLDLAPDHSFASLANRSEAIDPTFLHTTLTSHSSGVQVLAAPKRPEEADAIGVGCVESVVHLLRQEFDWVVWDTPRDFDDRSLLVLNEAALIVLVTTPDVPALNHTRMQLDLLKRQGHRSGSVRVVVNRTDRSASVSSNAAKEFLGRRVDATIPNDFPRASACVDEGRTLYDMARRSPLARAMGELALFTHSWCDQPSPDSGPRRGLLSRLIGK